MSSRFNDRGSPLLNPKGGSTVIRPAKLLQNLAPQVDQILGSSNEVTGNGGRVSLSVRVGGAALAPTWTDCGEVWDREYCVADAWIDPALAGR
jgi:hypothetical protein